MEEQYFEEIRTAFCSKNPDIKSGKMMSSEAITYKSKVFAFFSRKQKMVFKLGKDFDPNTYDIDISIFNPFKNRKPLYGWFEVSYDDKEQWEVLTQRSLNLIRQEL